MTFCKNSVRISCQIIFVNKHWPKSCLCPFKYPLLWEFWINYVYQRILGRVLVWKIVSKEWVSFFLGSWGMNVAQNKQIDRELLRGSHNLFVPHYDSFPMNPEKDTHSLNKHRSYFKVFHVILSWKFNLVICPDLYIPYHGQDLEIYILQGSSVLWKLGAQFSSWLCDF